MTTLVTAMSKPINIAVAKARLPELVERASKGEEIVIARHGKPQARLVPLARRVRRVAGRGAGQWQVADDFNASLPADVLAAFESRGE
jgi:prevent-host-death family protein